MVGSTGAGSSIDALPTIHVPPHGGGVSAAVEFFRGQLSKPLTSPLHQRLRNGSGVCHVWRRVNLNEPSVQG